MIFNSRLFFSSAFAATLLFSAACTSSNTGSTTSTASTDPASATITSDGGTLTSSDGAMTLTVPAGALSADTEITVTPIVTSDGRVYEFEPSGLTFSTPATVAFTTDLNDRTALVDENGTAQDTERNVPDVLLFLINDDDTVEALETSQVSSDGDSTTVTVTTQISHFTSLLSAAGNGMYAYMTSLGTHYVGPTFKADVSLRYLGYEATTSYRNSSITYKVNSVTVTKIEFTVTGAIRIDSPNPITRNDFLNTRGQESATRPRFHCEEVGTGTATVTVTGTAAVEATFQPEDRTRSYTINFSEQTTRNGRCIQRISLNDTSLTTGEETQVALVDPTDDVLIDEGNTGTLVPASSPPSDVDTDFASLSVLDDDHLAVNISVNGDVPSATSSNVSFQSFDLLILDPAGDNTGFTPFANALWDLSIDAFGTGTDLGPSVYKWNGSSYDEVQDLDLTGAILGDNIVMEIPLSDLDMTAEEARAADFRVVTQQTFNGEYFVDSLDLSFENTL